MNFPVIRPYREQAEDIVCNVMKSALDKMRRHDRKGSDFVDIPDKCFPRPVYLLDPSVIKEPIVKNAKKFIDDAIVKYWKLADLLMFYIKYIESSHDETSKYYYFEVVFSQPTMEYPIPQATASVFFRVQCQKLDPELNAEPIMTFRLEGDSEDSDVRFRRLTSDCILALIQMKIKIFKRIESYDKF